MPERKTLNEDLFYKGSSANLPRLPTCENKVPFWDFKEFAVTQDFSQTGKVATTTQVDMPLKLINSLELFSAKRLGNHIHGIFIFIFFFVVVSEEFGTQL